MPKKNITKQKQLIKLRLAKAGHEADSSRRLATVVPLTIILFLLAFSLSAVSYYKYQINPDATSYLLIAQNYASGNIYAAINGYWSPLLSWLLIPFAWVGINLQLGAKLIAIFSSTGSMLLCWRILAKQKVSWWITSAILFVVGSLLLSWSLVGPITGDILFVFFGLLTALALEFLTKKQSTLSVIGLGFCGAMLYFSKSIGFYVFLISLLLVFLLSQNYSKRSAKKYLAVILVFLTFCAPFIVTISIKYNRIGISAAQEYNLELAKHYYAGTKSYSHPMNWPNIIVNLPPQQHTMHENPNELTKYIRSNTPISQKAAIYHYYKNVINNMYKLITSAFIYIIIIGSASLLFIYARLGKRGLWRPSSTFLLAIIGWVTLIGAITSIYEERYVYILIIASFVGVGLLFKKLSNPLFSIMCCSLLIVSVLHTYNNLIDNSYININIHDDAVKLQRFIPPESNTVSDSSMSIYYCYYDKFKCFGTVTPTPDNYKDLKNQLKQHGVEYFIVTKPATLQNQSQKDVEKELGVQIVTVQP